eukprot:TRINITY_DN28494_c0_g1_i2.p1 TRINITY_DN28494_c0_g1~~TRINITY_DN28494_c0_g1_i2.p1  ORF type:complete len:761 (+),score=129.25 TRINITY_DN28494_c0_g1_i2:97-2379(+)
MASSSKKFKNSNLNAILGGPKESPANFGPAVRSATLVKPVAKPKGLVSLGKGALGAGNVRKGAAFRQLEDKARQEEENRKDDLTSPEWAVMDINDLDKPQIRDDPPPEDGDDGDDAGGGDVDEAEEAADQDSLEVRKQSSPPRASPPLERVPEEPPPPNPADSANDDSRRGLPPPPSSAPPPPRPPPSPAQERLRVQSWADESEYNDGDDEPFGAFDLGRNNISAARPSGREPPAGRPPQRPTNDKAVASAKYKAPGGPAPRRPPPGGPPPQPPPPAQNQALNQPLQTPPSRSDVADWRAPTGQRPAARGPPPSMPPPASPQERNGAGAAGPIGGPVTRGGKGMQGKGSDAGSHDDRKRNVGGAEPRAWDGMRRAAHAGSDGAGANADAASADRGGTRPDATRGRNGPQESDRPQEPQRPSCWGPAVACTPAFAPRGPPVERPMSEDFANSGWKEKKLWKPPEEPKAKSAAAAGANAPRGRKGAETGVGGVGQGIAGAFGAASNAAALSTAPGGMNHERDSAGAEAVHETAAGGGEPAAPSRPAKKPKEPRGPLEALDPESSSSDESDGSNLPAEYAVLDMTVPRTALVINVSHVLKRLNGCCSLQQLTKAIKHFKEKSGVTLEAFLRANPISFKLEGRIVYLMERGEIWKPPEGANGGMEGKGKGKGAKGKGSEEKAGGKGDKKGQKGRRGKKDDYEYSHDGGYGKNADYRYEESYDYGYGSNKAYRGSNDWKNASWDEKGWKEADWKNDSWSGWSAGW